MSLRFSIVSILTFTFLFSLLELGNMEYTKHPLIISGKSIYYISMLLIVKTIFPIPTEPITGWLVVVIMVISIAWIVFVLKVKTTC